MGLEVDYFNKMAKTITYLILIFVLTVSAGLFLIQGEAVTKNVGAENAQVAQLYTQGLGYALSPSEFQVGVPVRIEADMSRMPGCSRSVVISAFGVRKVLSSKDNVIEFTPTKTGTFNIACSMNMYRGTFTVTE